MKRLHFATLALSTLIFYFAISQKALLTGRAAQSWQGVDLGAPGSAGTQTSAGSQLNVTGSGKGIAASSLEGEQGRFVYQLASGDIEIVARLTNLSGGPISQAGLMLRESGNELAYMACAMYQSPPAPTTTNPNPPSGVFQRSRRAGLPDSPNAYNTNSGVSLPTGPPIWLKLVRVGKNYATFRSSDGRQWTPVQNYSGGAFTTEGSYWAGFFVSGGGSNAAATATFDSIYMGPPRLEYRTTWAGNTYSNDADRYVSAGIAALYVGTDGRSYTNAPYDEAGEAAKVYGSDGRVQRAISGIGGNTCIGGHCNYQGSVTGDSQNIYALRPISTSGVVYDLIKQTDINGGAAKTITPTTKTTIGGMAAGNGELFLSDTINNRVLVIDTTTRLELANRSFAFTRPGPMAMDRRGNLWIIQRATDHGSSVVQYTPAIRCYRPDGTFTGQEITDVVQPASVAIDPTQDRLLVAEAGPAQNIRFYALGGTAPVFSSTFGTPGGVFTGPNPGLLNDAANGGWQRLYGPNGVGMDAQGNLYVSCGAVGSHLRKFDSQGNLVWQLSGLTGVETPDFDPATDGQELYSARGHYSLDYNQTAPGTEWRFTGMNRNLLAPAGQSPPAGAATVVRRLGPNQERFMFTMPNVEGSIKVFRFQGELAIPCATYAYQPLDGLVTEYLWVDQNGDGLETADERTILDYYDRLRRWSGFDVDAEGNILLKEWSHNIYPGMEGTGEIRLVKYHGLNAQGVPLYTITPETSDSRIPFEVAFPFHFRYDTAADTMYFVGFTFDQRQVLARYDHWATPGRTLRYLQQLPTPYDNPNFLYFPPFSQTPNFIKISSTNPDSMFHYFTLDVVGDKVFIGELWGPIHVYDANFGNPVMRLNPGPEVSGVGGWTDIHMGAHAFRRANGEYVVIRSDASIRARNLIFRWTPATPAAPPDAPIKLKADSGSDRIQLTWEGAWGQTRKFALWRGTASGEETLYADNLTAPNFADTSIQFGTKYYYRVTASNEAGTSGFSNEVSAAANAAVRFTHYDMTTEGNWKGVYGQEGYDIVGDTSSFPSHLKYVPTAFDTNKTPSFGNSPYLPPLTFIYPVAPTSTEYLLKATSNERVDAYWRVGQAEIDLNLTDGQEHQVALYFLRRGSYQGIIEIQDINGKLLDRRTYYSSTTEGRYAVWKVSGHVRMLLSADTGVVPMVGLFIDPISSLPTTCSAGAPPVIITTQPQRRDICVGQSVTYTVQAEGQNLTYQWRKGKVLIPGAIGPSYTITSGVGTDYGDYDVMVTGACGTDLSRAVHLPKLAVPTVTSPTDQAVEAGTTVALNAYYTEDYAEPTTPQWQVSTDGGATYTNIPGGTPLVPVHIAFRSTLTLPAVTLAQNGYRYRVAFTNPCGTRTTNAAKLTVTSSATLTQINLAAASGSYGGTTALTATLTSGGAPVAGRTVNFSLQGVSLGAALTSASGVATWENVSLNSLTIGTYAAAISADFAGDANFLPSQGIASLTVHKATAAITLGNLHHIYDGTAKLAAATTPLAELAVTVAYSQAGTDIGQPVNAGSYDVVATIDEDNYQGSATGVLVITRATASLALSNLLQQYDGTPKAATVITMPENLSGLTVSYDGSPVNPFNAGSYQVLVSLTNNNYTALDATGTLIINAAPVVNAGSYSVVEGGSVAVLATATDPEGGALSYAWDFNGDGVFETAGQGATFSAANLDGPGSVTVNVRVSDTQGGITVSPAAIQINNAAPLIISLLGPVEPIQVGSAATLTGQFTDVGLRDTHTASWSWKDGGQPTVGTVSEANGSGTMSDQHTFTKAGVYEVALTVTDKDKATISTSYKFVVVYDLNGGFVTGGGWINSPAGAYAADLNLTGKANFGFVSKYQNGNSVPTGNTEFQFKAGNLNFSSTVYEWMVISGARAQYKGSGKINGAGDYRFMLTAIDGQVNGGGGTDKFRLRIWNNVGGRLVYDNQMNAPDSADPTTVLGGGSIVIHK